MSQIKVNALVSYSGNTVTLGTSGDTINVASNVTFNTSSNVVLPAGAAGTPSLTTQGDTNTGIFFPSADTLGLVTNGTERVTVNSSGNVQFAKNISIGGVTPTTSGFGITFPATASGSTDANTLDDYEEGTFTPTIIGTSTAGTGTYSRQTGTYTKIGNRVYYAIYIIWSAHTGTGDMNIGGLPFTSNSNNFAPSANRPSNLTLTANNLLVTWVVDSSSNVSLQQYQTGGNAAAGVAMDTSAEIATSGHYFI